MTDETGTKKTAAQLREELAAAEAEEAAAAAKTERASAAAGDTVPDHVHVAAGHNTGTGEIITGPVFRGE